MPSQIQEAISLAWEVFWLFLASAVFLMILRWLMSTDKKETTRQPQPCRHYDPSEDDEEVRVETHA